jgi:hypothetical protein
VTNRAAIASLVFLLGLALARPAAGQDLASAFARLAERLDRVSELRGKKIGVGDFPTVSGHVTELGAFVADQLDVALTGRSSSAGYGLVTRSHLCQVIRENKLWVDDRFDPSLNKKLGRLGHADYLLSGQLTPLARTVSVSLRLLDTETGAAVWAESTTLALDEGLRRLMERRRIGDGCGHLATLTPAAAPAVATPNRLTVKVATDHPSYRIGDSVRLRLRVSRDAYVTLVNIGTSGEVAVLYPNRFHSGHFIRGGEEVVIPPEDAGFTLTVLGPPGFDQIRAIATIEPVKIHASDFAGQRVTFRSLDRVQTRDFAVGIAAERERVAADKWAEHVIAVEIRR